MKITINFEKKHFYIIAALLGMMVMFSIVMAAIDTSKPWHPLRQIAIKDGSLQSVADAITITDDLKVGIGNTNPTQKLDIGGNIEVSGTVDGYDISAKAPLWEADTSTTNEIQALGKNGNKITLSKNGGEVEVPYAESCGSAQTATTVEGVEWFGNSGVLLKDGAKVNEITGGYNTGTTCTACAHGEAKKENGKIYTRAWVDNDGCSIIPSNTNSYCTGGCSSGWVQSQAAECQSSEGTVRYHAKITAHSGGATLTGGGYGTTNKYEYLGSGGWE